MVKKVVMFLIVSVFMQSIVSAALGLTPSIVKMDFVPGGETELLYTVISDKPDQDIEITVGESEFITTLSKERIKGPGTFKIYFKFPQEVSKPGENRIGIRVQEVAKENSFLGTAISISGVIIVNVPYPGKYVEAELTIPDGNVNEEIPVELYTVNRGSEDASLNVNIGFFEDGEKMIYNMPFTPVLTVSNEERFFRKYLETKGWRPGNYFAEAEINYGGDLLIVNKSFRIGSLFVNVSNFTEKLPGSGGIEKFNVDVKSMWNNKLSEVYADVNISNSTYSQTFRTPSVELEKWDEKTLVGFIDTNGLKGKYKSEIELNYQNRKTSVNGNLKVSDIGINMTYIVMGAIAIIIIIVIIIIIYRMKRKAIRIIKK